MSHSRFKPICPCIAHGPFALFEVRVLTAFPRAPQVVILSYFRLRRCPIAAFWPHLRVLLNVFVAGFARVRNCFAFLIFGGWPVLHTPFVHASRGSCEGSINKSICLVNAFYLRFVCPESIYSYDHQVVGRKYRP